MTENAGQERVSAQVQWPEGVGRSATVVNQMLLTPGASVGPAPDGLFYLFLGHIAPPIVTEDRLEAARSGQIELSLDVKSEVIVTAQLLRQLRTAIDEQLGYLDADGQS